MSANVSKMKDLSSYAFRATWGKLTRRMNCAFGDAKWANKYFPITEINCRCAWSLLPSLSSCSRGPLLSSNYVFWGDTVCFQRQDHMTANRGPSIKPSPGTEPKMRRLPVNETKDMQNWSGTFEGQPGNTFPDGFHRYTFLFIKQFHQNGAFTFIGMLALKAW